MDVLLVDDDCTLRLLLGDALRVAGHRVDTAPDADTAESHLAKNSYQLVITDLRAPRIDGLSLLRRVRKDRPDTDVVLTTFRPGVPEAALALGEGALEYLIKPFDVEEAVARISRIASERAHRNGRATSVDEPLSLLVIAERIDDADSITEMLIAVQPDTEIARASTVEDAMARVRGLPSLSGKSRWDALVCSLPFASMNALDAILELHGSAPHTPIVVLADDRDEALAVRAVQVGAQDYLVKTGLDGATLQRAVAYAVERKRAEGRLVYLSHHDQLTGLANRTLFRERLSHARARSRRDHRKVAMMVLDIDRFKHINAELGHEAGDALLREVAKRLTQTVRDQDTVARIGSDEFAVLLEDVEGSREAAQIAERVLEAVKKPVTIVHEQMVITTSIGVAVSPDVWDVTTDLVASADQAMVQAKSRGRDSYHVYGDANGRARTAKDLKLALERNEFILHYQPLLTAKTQEVIGNEALLRWRRPNGAVIPPADFIPFLEETGLIIEVGARVLEMACVQLAAWTQKDGKRIVNGHGARVSVNLSPVQFDDEALSETVMRSIDRAGISPDQLELEITESLLMRDTARAQATLSTLKSHGVRIAIDDFGTGYSSLAYLHRFPVDTLKIDRTFIHQIAAGGSGAAIVGAIIGLAHKLNIEVVAEGVETEEQLAFLKRENCDIIQGYLAGRPVPPT